ncbi:hypothetical protein [Streptomyces sp. L2]|uniref:hypothetical protein n=1 Tax=Streptomyces sp. L2 TaxID=2162665 RepID=UPI00101044B1|nr:hypothetical protein [Streptomyces sp. L2]
MQRRGQTLKLAAVSSLVVLALTGFTSRHHSHGHGGGGCSSSHQDHDTVTHHHYYDDDDDDDYTGGSTSSGTGGYATTTPVPTATATTTDVTAQLISCATKKAPYATVEVTNAGSTGGDYTVHVDFDNAQGTTVAENDATVTVPAYDSARVRVKLSDTAGVSTAGLAAKVDHCALDPEVRPAT